jgi:hypothetical protein
MPERKASHMTDTTTTDLAPIRIAGLVVRRQFTPKLIPVLEELRDTGMKFVFRNEISIQPDDRFLFVLSDRPFDDEAQQHEANAILADLLNFDSQEEVRFTTQGVHGVFEVIDFIRV